jgi:Spy/CpxP family protein refolding chaperone
MKKEESKDCQERGRHFFWASLLIIGGVLMLSAFSHSRTHEKTGSFRVHMIDKVETVLDQLDATGEQRSRAEAIAADIAEYSDHFDAARIDLTTRLIEALAREDIDVESFASIRIEMLELTDEASAKLFDALYDLSELLTPAQRAELLELVRERSWHK